MAIPQIITFFEGFLILQLNVDFSSWLVLTGFLTVLKKKKSNSCLFLWHFLSVFPQNFSLKFILKFKVLNWSAVIDVYLSFAGSLSLKTFSPRSFSFCHGQCSVYHVVIVSWIPIPQVQDLTFSGMNCSCLFLFHSCTLVRWSCRKGNG